MTDRERPTTINHLVLPTTLGTQRQLWQQLWWWRQQQPPAAGESELHGAQSGWRVAFTRSPLSRSLTATSLTATSLTARPPLTTRHPPPLTALHYSPNRHHSSTARPPLTAHRHPPLTCARRLKPPSPPRVFVPLTSPPRAWRLRVVRGGGDLHRWAEPNNNNQQQPPPRQQLGPANGVVALHLGRLLVKLGESGWSSQPPPSCCGIHERCGPYDHTMTDDFAPARECCSRLLRYPASRSLLCFSRRP
ncbi:unnamed protein product [Lampetra planeri]